MGAMMIEPDSQTPEDDTSFWESQPGVHEDIDSGRAAAPDELYDESAVRRRYGVATPDGQ